jgi:hypothetical protein
VDWFNKVDATYRSEFRDLFETHFSRFDAKLEQRVAEVRAEFQERLARLEAKLEHRTAELRAELQIGLRGVEVRLVRWMFLFWAGSLGTTIALLKL